ncbi:precorrin-6y C5,15-methyltransferase (decarboxylating) subunit CbiE (plasmid) [Rhizobium grahamii]|uniref:Precorrin-6y C5,15-methyltransferase (Decarboxylating) subunit CbiE n=1 Tax=Rhizobium grahamii TaxID=1120045 RepID=A0A5Q0CED1_9HYPH|nr:MULTISPECIES: precorrin-6y C5,15-methyltransferase (decarboxylating) subunit CbiE [Rhizobium]QFY63703.1 precorrin-6y C5,15-methyltransferase (decarboxylating) subunit CbiE [Rhizobium grahamii]QRM51533.1 precorrin-6y C5,15-methyltransferase (decarboxylating) subunit CbiE [Rhizobium sp. BG6]
MSETSIAPGRWLTIIGIGEDGLAGLGEQAKHLISAAPVVYGGARHHALMAPLVKGQQLDWASPFERSVEEIVARRGTPVVVLASGDPFLYGVGATLSRHVSADEILTIPAPSSFSLAASRLGWALQDVASISLHGRPIELLYPHLHPGRRIIALTSDAATPAQLVALLCKQGFAESKIHVLEALGGSGERIRQQQAEYFNLDDIDPLNVCALEIAGAADARVIGFASGLDDRFFDHDGQLTKREHRAITLSALSPRYGELLWDIGSGSGSIAIEWMLQHHSLKAIAIEQSVERAQRIARNATNLGVPTLAVVEGRAPEALEGLPCPDVIFVGGGGSEDGVIDAALAALKPGGRIVANGVTLEMEAKIMALHAAVGGSMTRIEISRVTAIGQMTGWRPAMPVTQWCWTKE